MSPTRSAIFVAVATFQGFSLFSLDSTRFLGRLALSTTCLIGRFALSTTCLIGRFTLNTTRSLRFLAVRPPSPFSLLAFGALFRVAPIPRGTSLITVLSVFSQSLCLVRSVLGLALFLLTGAPVMVTMFLVFSGLLIIHECGVPRLGIVFRTHVSAAIYSAEVVIHGSGIAAIVTMAIELR
jgi:hypothetical protein